MNKEHKTEERYIKITFTETVCNTEIKGVKTWELPLAMFAFNNAIFTAIGDNFEMFFRGLAAKLSPDDKEPKVTSLPEAFESFMKNLLERVKQDS